MKNSDYTVPYLLILIGILSLFITLGAGVFAATSFLAPDAGMNTKFSFYTMRPLHVSAALFWILSGAIGVTLFASFEIAHEGSLRISGSRLPAALWGTAVVGALICLGAGVYEGREYWEFPPIFSLFLLVSWIGLATQFFSVWRQIEGPRPVYQWMWATGFLSFVFTLLESNAWLLPWFNDNIVRDITVQWKANGAIIGSWNMLIYGTGMYVMSRISGNADAPRRPLAFTLYFIGFTNLMFNWGHHTYPLPTAPWIRTVSYFVSMIEWLLLINIIRNWRASLTEAQRHIHLFPYRFLFAAEIWVLLNLLLALLMSIPALNLYTHGTHVTVAHAMGTTIGINTMLLIGCLLYCLGIFSPVDRAKDLLTAGFWIGNTSLLIVWLALIVAGITKGYLTMTAPSLQFAEVMAQVTPFLVVFKYAGISLFIGLTLVSIILIRSVFRAVSA